MPTYSEPLPSMSPSHLLQSTVGSMLGCSLPRTRGVPSGRLCKTGTNKRAPRTPVLPRPQCERAERDTPTSFDRRTDAHAGTLSWKVGKYPKMGQIVEVVI